MQLHIIDTIKIYESPLPHLNERLLEPFEPMLKIMGMNREMLYPSMINPKLVPQKIEEQLEILKKANIEIKIIEALSQAEKIMVQYGLKIPEKIILGVFLGDEKHLAQSNGYTGFGGIPGYIMINISPTENNIHHIPAAAVHEFQHNIQFTLKPFNPMTIRLKEYMMIEGLAERFSVEICGQEHLGPWVSEVTEQDIQTMKELVKNKLNERGFQNVNKYLFGGGDIPLHGGYACGYHLVDAYMNKTAKSLPEIMDISPDVLIEETGYFNNK